MASDTIGLLVAVRGLGEFRRAVDTIEGDIRRVEGALERLGAGSAIVSFGRQISEFGSAISSMGRTVMMTVTGPLSLLSGTLVAAGVRFEDTFAEIGKTVEGVSVGFEEIARAAQEHLGITITTMDEAQAVAEQLGMRFGSLTPIGIELAEAFRRLGQEIPMSYEELNRLGGVVGQLGVQTPASVLEVTRTIAMLGTTTDMMAEEAAMNMMHFANIMGIVADQIPDYIHRMGSAIVDLGNNSASTESEIVAMAMRLAAAGRIAGMSSEDILGWATALTDMGIRAEMGGTAVSRVIQNIMFAVADGGEALAAFATVAGQTADEFAANFRANPTAAIEEFLERIVALQEDPNGAPGLQAMLADMGLAGVRVRDVMNRLGGNLDLVRRNIELSNAAWRENIAMENEAEKRYATFNSQLQLLRNRFADLGIEIFNLVRHKLEVLVDTIGRILDWFKHLDDQTQMNILVFAGLAAAIGPLLLLIGGLISAIGTIVTAIGALASPIGIAIAAVVALGAAIYGAIRIIDIPISADNIFAAIGGLIDAIRPSVEWLLDALGAIGQGLGLIRMPQPEMGRVPPGAGFAERFTRFGGRPDELSGGGVTEEEREHARYMQELQGAAASLRAELQELFGFLSTRIGKAFEAFIRGFTEGFTAVDRIGPAVERLKEAFLRLLEALSPLVESVKRFLGALLGLAGEEISFRDIGIALGEVFSVQAARTIDALTGAIILLTDAIAFVTPLIVDAGEGFYKLYYIGKFVLQVLGELYLAINSFIVSVIAKVAEMGAMITQVFIQSHSNVVMTVAAMVGSVVQFFSYLRDTIITILAEFVGAVLGHFLALAEQLVGRSIVPDMVGGIIAEFTGLVTRALPLVETLVNSIIGQFDLFRDRVATAVGVVVNKITTIVNALQSLYQWLANNIAQIISWIGSIGGAYAQTAAQMQNSPQLTIQTSFEMLYKWLRTHPMEMQLAVPSLPAVSAALQGIASPVAPAAGPVTNYSIVVNGAPIANVGDAAAEMARAYRLIRATQG